MKLTYQSVARGAVDSEYAIIPDAMLLVEAAADIEEAPRPQRTRGGTLTGTVKRAEPLKILWGVSPAGALWVANINERRVRELSLAGDTLRTISRLRRRDGITTLVVARRLLRSEEGRDILSNSNTSAVDFVLAELTPGAPLWP